MKTSRFSDSQIIAVSSRPRAVPGSRIVPGTRHQFGHVLQMASKFGGMDASMMARIKELEDENARLKKMYAEERLKADIRAGGPAKKVVSHLADARWPTNRRAKAIQIRLGLRHFAGQRDLLPLFRPRSMPRMRKSPTG